MIWDAIRYGWAPMYYLTIEGIPVIWSEGRDGVAIGLPLPAGNTAEAPVLNLAQCGELGVERIDRDTGAALGGPMAFRLRDSATLSAYLQHYTLQTRLTTSASVSTPTFVVESTTGWGATGEFYIGMERVTYTGKTPTSFTGCARATVGYPYAHTVGTAGQTITNLPRYWRGRIVELWAAPVDQGGHVTGYTLGDDAVKVWVGKITAGPQRERDGFSFEAESLDAVLQRELSGKVTGRVVGVGGKYVVKTGQTVRFDINATDAAGVSVSGFPYSLNVPIWPASSGKVDGDLVTGADIRKAMVNAFATGVSDANGTADLDSYEWFQVSDAASPVCGMWRSVIRMDYNATIEGLDATITIDDFGVASYGYWSPGGWTGPGPILITFIHWNVLDSPFHAQQTGGLTLEIDDGDTSTLAAPLVVAVKGPLGFAWEAETVSVSGAHVYFGATSGQTPGGLTPAALSKVIGADAEVLQAVEDTYSDLMVTALQSSGTGNRGSYDTLPRGCGYGIDDALINMDSFADPVVAMEARIDVGGATFAGLFGGILGLMRRAVVGRMDDGLWKLRLVSTDIAGAPTAASITDADLLSFDGDPLLSVRRLDPATSIRIVITEPGTPPFWSQPAGESIEHVVEVNSIDLSEAMGRRQVEYAIAATDPKKIIKQAKDLAYGMFSADQTVQAIELAVGPWVDAQPGDVVALTLTHPALWTWSTATQGYTGTARVVGRRMDPTTLKVTLTLLIDGGVTFNSLSPSAEVSAFGGIATSVTSMTIGIQYLDLMQKAFAAMGQFKVQHYRPGQVEAEGQTHRVTAVAEFGGACVLTVDTHAGGHTVVAGSSRITWPTLLGGDHEAWQGYFSHADDGSSWG